MKKKVLIVLSSLLVLCAAGLWGGHAWLKGLFEKESLVRQIEAAWNCRASLDSTSVSIASMPAQVELHGLKLAPRDGEVLKPLAHRAPLDDKAVLLSVNNAVLTVELTDLVHRRLSVKQLRIFGVNARNDVGPNGESNLSALFDKPGSEHQADAGQAKDDKDKDKSTPQTVSANASQPNDNNAKVEEPSPAKPDQPAKMDQTAKPEQLASSDNSEFKAGDMVVALKVDEAGVEDANFTIDNPSQGSVIHIEHVRLTLKNMDVNPADLAHHDDCEATYQGSIRVENIQDKAVLADITISGSGHISPFNDKTGEWDPDLSLDAAVRKGAVLGGMPLEKQISPQDAKKFAEWGLDFGDTPVGGVLAEDTATQVHVVHGKTIIKQDTRLVFPQYELTLLEKSWFNPGADSISAHYKFTAGPDLTKKLLDQAGVALKKQLGDTLGNMASEVMKKTLVDDQKRVTIQLRAKGKLSKPTMELDSAMLDVKDAVKDVGSSFLNGLLGK